MDIRLSVILMELSVVAMSVSVNLGGNIILVFYVHGIYQDFEKTKEFDWDYFTSLVSTLYNLYTIININLS